MEIAHIITLFVGISPALCAFVFRKSPRLRTAATIWTLLFCVLQFFTLGMFAERLADSTWIEARGQVPPSADYKAGVHAALQVCAPFVLYLLISAIVLGAVAIRSREPESDRRAKGAEA